MWVPLIPESGMVNPCLPGKVPATWCFVQSTTGTDRAREEGHLCCQQESLKIMGHRRFDHVHLVGDWTPPFHDPRLSLEDVADQTASAMKGLGCTAMSLNYLTIPYHPLLYLYPDEVYMFFGAYAPPLDMFAESSYSKDIWPRWFLEENLQRLGVMGQAAERYGLTGMLYLCEPRMQHPALFERHPSWRGPRVDNPNASKTPVYSLNTDVPEVQDHYQQLFRTVHSVAPGIRDLVFFSQDSGAGFGFAHHLYCGPNGGRLHASKPFAQRVFDFCAALRDEGRKKQSGFEVSLTTSFSDEELEHLYAEAPEGIHIAVRGPESWCGGLEDEWALNQCGPERLGEIGFDMAREERIESFRGYVDQVKRAGRNVRCLSQAPNDLYFQLVMVPNPWEPLEILQRYENWGADQIFLRGYLNFSRDVAFDINQASLTRFLGSQGVSPEVAVRESLAEWVREPAVAFLEEALRHVAEAVRFRPHYRTFAEKSSNLFPGPLVPDPGCLSDEEKSYYWNVCHETWEGILGPHFWMPRMDRARAEYIFRQFESATFPGLREAYTHFEGARQAANGDASSLACIDQLERHSRLYECLQHTLYHLAQMLVRWCAVDAVDVPSPPEIVEAEILNTRRWIDLLGDDPGKWVRLAPFPGAIYSPSVALPLYLAQRIEVMEAHQGDPVFSG